MKNNKYYNKRECGSAFLEAAIVFPILFALIFGIIDFSRVMWAEANITNALADAARSAEVLDLTDHQNRAEVARILIQALKRYKTSVSTLYCKPGDTCPKGGAASPAKIRMEWIQDNGRGMYDAIQNSHTVRDVFYQAAAEGQSPTFDNSGRDSSLSDANALPQNGFIGLSVMFRPNCLICKFLLGKEVLFRRSIFVPYSGNQNPFDDPVCAGSERTCLVNPKDGTLIAEDGNVCGTCRPDPNY